MISGAVSIAVLNATGNILLAMLSGIIAGAISGCFTACLHVHFRVSRLLSGVITWALLYSITIRTLGGLSNLEAKGPTFFTALNAHSSETVEFVIVSIASLLLVVIAIAAATSHWGRVSRAFGDQPWFAVGLGFSPKTLTILGLALANTFIGVGGVLLCQFREVCDVNMSAGVLVAGLASLVMGEAVFNTRKIWQYIITVSIGSIIYNLAITAFYFDWGIGLEKVLLSSDVRFVSGLMLLIPAVLVAQRRSRYKLFTSEW
jgi:putative ABC transport system permease protein